MTEAEDKNIDKTGNEESGPKPPQSEMPSKVVAPTGWFRHDGVCYSTGEEFSFGGRVCKKVTAAERKKFEEIGYRFD